MLFDPEGDVKELGKGSILKIANKIIQGMREYFLLDCQITPRNTKWIAFLFLTKDYLNLLKTNPTKMYPPKNP